MKPSLFSLVMAASVAKENELQKLGQEYQALKEIKGHWQNAAYNPKVDSPLGKKYTVMKQLGEQLNCSSFQTILSTLGEPDEVGVENGGKLPVMPGPFIGEPSELPREKQGNVVLKYFWRNQHDYLYFVVDVANETMPAKSGWYHAGE